MGGPYQMLHPGFGVDASDKLYQRLKMPPNSNDVTLEYVDASTCYVWTNTYDRYWARWKISLMASSLWAFDDLDACDVLKAWSDRDVSVTYNGVWTQWAPAAALNATGSHASVAGRYVEFSVTPGVGGKIYLVLSYNTNCGYANVTIDGGTDLVNEVPLVGGNRRISCYGAAETYNNRLLIASGLEAATSYTVRITVTGTKPDESSGTRVAFEGYGVFAITIDDAQIGTLLYDRKIVRQIVYSGSSNNYAYEYKPGAGNYAWTGSDHLEESITATTFEDGDGNDVSVTAVDTRNGAATIVVENTGTSTHPDVGGNHANVIARFTFTSAGLNAYHQHTWLTASTFDLAYVGMLAVREANLTRGHVASDAGAIYDLTPDDDTYHGQKKSRLAAVWHASFPWVAWVYLPNLTGVGGWANSTRYMSIADLAAGTFNKVYAQRVGGTASQPNASAAIGDVWESTVYYRLSYIENPETAINWI